MINRSQPINVLFFTPTGGRGGSEAMLRHLLNNLPDNINWHCVTGIQGSRINDKSFPGRVSVIPSGRGRTREIIDKIARNVASLEVDERFIMKLHKKFKPDIWYINTSTLQTTVELASRQGIPFITHFHELWTVYDQVKDVHFERIFENGLLTIACSSAVNQALVTMGAKNVVTIHECVDLDQISPNLKRRDQIRQDMGYSSEDFVWAMSGATSPRKGVDLFIKTALLVENPNIKFLWIGHQRDHGYNLWVRSLAEENNLDIRWIEELDHDQYYDYLNASDGFFLSSREDPFPLVMIEAGYLKKPIIGFNSGGFEEFINESPEYAIPNFDLRQAATRISEVSSNREISETNRERAKEFDSAVIVQQWVKTLENVTRGA